MTPQKPKPSLKKKISSTTDSTNKEPKRYDFVPLSNSGTNRGKVVGHEAYKEELINGKLSLDLTVQTSSFVATGHIVLGSDVSANVPLIKTAYHRNQKLLIPGSSLKGAVRSAYEAITKSCLCKTKATVPDEYSECRVTRKNRESEELVCPACQVFGAMGWQGIVSFPDVVGEQASDNIGFVPSLYKPQPDRGTIKGRKFYHHYIEVDNKAEKGLDAQIATRNYVFKTTLHLKNISQTQLGTLLIVLGQDARYPMALKVGGGKPIGMGTMTVSVKSLEKHQNLKERYSSYFSQECDRLTDEELKSFVDRVIASAHKSLVEKQQLEKLAEILKWPTDKALPENI
ncbi:MAG: RAMP superfamily CRISPR-associated protein [Cyanophyceae cyanobacterium]